MNELNPENVRPCTSEELVEEDNKEASCNPDCTCYICTTYGPYVPPIPGKRMDPLRVGQLKALLADLPDDTLVVVTADQEGNNSREAFGVQPFFWDGDDFYDNEADAEGECVPAIWVW